MSVYWYFVNRSEDENDSEIDSMQNVQKCVTSGVIPYTRRYSFCTDSASFAYCIPKRIKAGGSGEEIVPVTQDRQ